MPAVYLFLQENEAHQTDCTGVKKQVKKQGQLTLLQLKPHHSPISGGLRHANLGLTQYSAELCSPLVTLPSSVKRTGPLMSLFSAFLQSSGYPSAAWDLRDTRQSRTLICSSTAACGEGNLRWLPMVSDLSFLPGITLWRHQWAAISAQTPDHQNHSGVRVSQIFFQCRIITYLLKSTQADEAVWNTTAVSHCSPEVYIHLGYHNKRKSKKLSMLKNSGAHIHSFHVHSLLMPERSSVCKSMWASGQKKPLTINHV